jgi:PKD repeat protein
MYSTIRSFTTFALLAFSFLTVSGIFFSTEHAQALGPQCTAPYVQVQDAAPSNPTTDPTGEFSIQSVSMGEPRNVPTPSFPNSTPVPQLSCSGKRITAVMKVTTMDPGNSGQAVPQPNGYWHVQFTIPGSANSTGADQGLFIEFNTASASTIGTPNGYVNFGHITPDGGGCYECAPGLPCNAYGTVAPDGTITMSMDLSAGYTFGTCTGTGTPDVAITVPAATWTPGVQITNIQGTTQVQGQGLVSGSLANLLIVNQAQTAGDGTYTVQGNVSCSNAPIAALSATPTSGNAPLTVNFDASASNVPSGGCGTINTYIFDFGDGQQATQSTPTVAHSYTVGGVTYHARVRVKTTFNVTSSNIAQQDITVNSAGPPLLTSVVSRKTHGALLPAADLVLSLSGTPTLEPRAGGLPSGNHSLVFSFLNPLTAAGTPTATATTTGLPQSVSCTGTPPSGNTFTVNCTGVPNASHLSVILNGMTDSAGNSGAEPPVNMDVLFGDVSGSRRTDSGDVTQVRNRTVTIPDTTNPASFLYDVNLSGRIDSGDVTATRNATISVLPAAE